MAADTTACAILQEEEWEVLEVHSSVTNVILDAYLLHSQSIFPDCVSNGSVKKLEIPVDLGKLRNVDVVSDAVNTDHLYPTASSKAPPIDSNTLKLSSLPPVHLEISLPADYPFTSPPQIVSIYATHSWIPSIQRLRQQLADKWQPGEGVLYEWVEWIRSSEFLSSLELISEGSTECIRHVHSSSTTYNRAKVQ
jgi:E3 ubiquitin-protein ligase RNF14